MDTLEFIRYLRVMDSFITLIAFVALLGMIGSSYPEIHAVRRRVAMATHRFWRGVIGPANKRRPGIGP